MGLLAGLVVLLVIGYALYTTGFFEPSINDLDEDDEDCPCCNEGKCDHDDYP